MSKINIVSLEREDDMPEQPYYGWGTEIHLEDETLEKMGMKEEAKFEVGETMAIMGYARVIGYSERERPDGTKCMCMDLQITDLGMVGEPDDEKEPAGGHKLPKTAGQRLYGDN